MKNRVDTRGFCALITCKFCKLNNFSLGCNLVHVEILSGNKNVIRFSLICRIPLLQYGVVVNVVVSLFLAMARKTHLTIRPGFGSGFLIRNSYLLV